MDDSTDTQGRITPRVIDQLYTEAMLLADEARAYFDEEGKEDRAALDPFARVGFACESLKVTTRIMHIVAWLLTQRAVESGELTTVQGKRPERRLGNANASDEKVVAMLPEHARELIRQSTELYERVKWLDEGQVADTPAQSPARALMGRLERDFLGG